ncbi:MAG: tRNA pseudouridine(55) synthase TruB [Thermoflexales bacterium]|nr:tRNA pseudouridine(55) synthase TruB [Thermoflexales bacterium]
MDGILNFNKAQGWTSHDVVAYVRRQAGQKRVGHAGTLDPLATGVLLVCLGQATRVAEYLMASDKVYLARVHLGVTTDTYDAEGQVSGTSEVRVDEAALQAALQHFTGEIEQVPPMYSALKQNGQRLYRLARQGVQVERPPRKVRIESISLRQLSWPELTLEVHCSSGTYIRSLAHDIGQALGCGAHLSGLVRQASGLFRVEQAVSASILEQTAAEGRLAELLHPLDTALQAMPAVSLDAEMARRVRHGQSVPLALSPGQAAPACRAYDDTGQLVAVMVYRAGPGDWRPDKVFGM